MSKVRAIIDGRGGHGQLFVDDFEVKGLTKIEFSVSVDGPNQLVVHLLADDVVIESKVQSPEET